MVRLGSVSMMADQVGRLGRLPVTSVQFAPIFEVARTWLPVALKLLVTATADFPVGSLGSVTIWLILQPMPWVPSNVQAGVSISVQVAPSSLLTNTWLETANCPPTAA